MTENIKLISTNPTDNDGIKEDPIEILKRSHQDSSDLPQRSHQDPTKTHARPHQNPANIWEKIH